MGRELARARRALAGVSCYSEALGREIVGRVAAGESVQAICADPRMPWPSTVWSWTRAHAGFAEALFEARRTARIARRVAGRLAAAARAARARERARRPSGYSAEVAAEICERLAEGESLIAIARDPAMPCASTVYDWLERHPEFEDAYARARRLQADYLFDEAREVALGATPKSVWADRLRFDAIRWQAARLAPRKYCERVVVLRDARAETAPQGMTVIVKRYSDITEEKLRRAEEGEP